MQVFKFREFTKSLFYAHSFVWSLGVIFCLIVIVTPIFAQNLLLELKTCNPQLQVFEDGTMTELRDGKKMARRLSPKRMRKLRRVFADSPCWKYLQKPDTSSADSSNNPQLTAGIFGNECYAPIIISGKTPEGVQIVEVTRHDINLKLTIAGYIRCGRSKTNKRSFINRNWQRFVRDAVGALKNKDILKGCECPKDNFRR